MVINELWFQSRIILSFLIQHHQFYGNIFEEKTTEFRFFRYFHNSVYFRTIRAHPVYLTTGHSHFSSRLPKPPGCFDRLRRHPPRPGAPSRLTSAPLIQQQRDEMRTLSQNKKSASPPCAAASGNSSMWPRNASGRKATRNPWRWPGWQLHRRCQGPVRRVACARFRLRGISRRSGAH